MFIRNNKVSYKVYKYLMSRSSVIEFEGNPPNVDPNFLNNISLCAIAI